MSQQPIVLTLPHQLGKAEALKRLKAGFQHTESQSAGGFVAFRISGQATTWIFARASSVRPPLAPLMSPRITLGLSLSSPGSCRCWLTARRV
jgi:hypothetical protein